MKQIAELLIAKMHQSNTTNTKRNKRCLATQSSISAWFSLDELRFSIICKISTNDTDVNSCCNGSLGTHRICDKRSTNV